MAIAFRDGHLAGNDNWQPLWPAITPLPDENNTPPTNPLDGSLSATLILYISQGNATGGTFLKLGDTGEEREYLAVDKAQAKVTIPLSPLTPAPQIKLPSGAITDFKLQVHS